MPDKWEYPWYAAWDLAFHCVPLALVDSEFAKEQLLLLLREWYMHPNGQLPAYEWALGDVNPPVHAWAALRVYQIEKKRRGTGDRAFLERVFQKLLLNFTWWVNRKDAEGMNVFQGGFLGLDNIGVFDRSAPLPTGGHLEQSDGTSWMAMYSLNMLAIATELAKGNPSYEDVASKFWEHFLNIAHAMGGGRLHGGHGHDLWDDEDGFFYDVLHTSDGTHAAAGALARRADPAPRRADARTRAPGEDGRFPSPASLVPGESSRLDGERRLHEDAWARRAAPARHTRRRSVAERSESDAGRGRVPVALRHPGDLRDSPRAPVSPRRQRRPDIRSSTSRPKSSTGLFGGNSNWRGPIWFPINYLLIEALQKFHHYYGNEFTVECPTGSGQLMTLGQVAEELSRRLSRIFLRNDDGRRPVFGGLETVPERSALARSDSVPRVLPR